MKLKHAWRFMKELSIVIVKNSLLQDCKNSDKES